MTQTEREIALTPEQLRELAALRQQFADADHHDVDVGAARSKLRDAGIDATITDQQFHDAFHLFTNVARQTDEDEWVAFCTTGKQPDVLALSERDMETLRGGFRISGAMLAVTAVALVAAPFTAGGSLAILAVGGAAVALNS